MRLAPYDRPARVIIRIPALMGAIPALCVPKRDESRTMKATIERATLLRCLSHVQSVVERRNTIPILSNVLIEASADGAIKLMATDLDLQVVESVSAQVEQAGATTISAHTLFDIARKLPEGSQVSLEAAENRMAIKAGRSRFSLPTLPGARAASSRSMRSARAGSTWSSKKRCPVSM